MENKNIPTQPTTSIIPNTNGVHGNVAHGHSPTPVPDIKKVLTPEPDVPPVIKYTPPPAPTEVPPNVIGRTWKKYPGFIKSYYNQKANEEDVYLDVAEMPHDLLPRIPDMLPFNFADEALQRNLTQKKLDANGEEEPSFLDQIPLQYKHFFMSPHPIYSGGLYILLNLKEVKRDKPIATLDELHNISMRGTTSVYQVYRMYRVILHFFEGHFMIKKSNTWAERTHSIFDRWKKRMTEILQAYKRQSSVVNGIGDIQYKVSRKMNTPLGLYSEKIGEEFAKISFNVCVSILNIMELAIMELMQIDTKLAAKSGFLTPSDVPPLNDISDDVKVAVLQDVISFVIEICNETTVEDKYDIAHITKYASSNPWVIGPSYFYQTLLFLLAITPPEEAQAAAATTTTPTPIKS